ncbi:NAD(P)-dependent alcohol dehydrogenase [Arthrobacter sp. CAU 1506]|uniref:NAD(P)-dependent alcohol dehydrogenase n=1 Tax=Arthrobacter sp. CAU 1506 TaxID=2560052 RepID=UPI001F0E732C|nr:NAD(P)-dependent alcohol dehydrogenase [Arthrobacter sp. CAU 1506]
MEPKESSTPAAPTSQSESKAAAPDRTMRAMVQRKYGLADALQLDTVAVPDIADNQVLIRVRAAGLDRGTWHMATGLPYPVRAVSGWRTPKNPILGLDVAGTVAAVGSAVTRFAVGDEIFGFGKGCFAEYAVASEKMLAAKPAALTFEQAAAVPVSGTTALQALRDAGRLQAGQSVLITGASGGVGTYAVQIAVAMGATVTGVCSAAKADLVRSLGAETVIDYARQDFAADGRRYDVIIDAAGNPSLKRLRRALTPGGTAVIVGGEGGDRWTGGLFRPIGGMLLSLFSRQRFVMFMARENATEFERLGELIVSGKVAPSIDRTYPLEQVPVAIGRLDAGEVRGKAVITV